MTNKIVTSTEILGALLSADIGASTEQLKADSSGFIAGNYGIDLSAIDVSVVENSDDALHLSLPYYSVLESVSVSSIGDEELTDLAGSELITLILAAILIGGGLATVFASATTSLGILAFTDENK